jgi:CheY-like chemotaxis protein
MLRRRMAERRQTALGVARARFLEGLPRKAREVRAAVALLADTPDEERPREELRRRLHALYASAQVFRIEPLAGRLREALELLDDAREGRRGVDEEGLELLGTLAAELPGLGAGARLPEGASSLASLPPRPGPMSSHPPSSQAEAQREEGPATEPGSAAPSWVISALVLDDAAGLGRIRGGLPPESFEVRGVADVAEAVGQARRSAPDVVLAASGPALAGKLVERLREDPLTDAIPVLLIVPEGAEIPTEVDVDGTLPAPFDDETLRLRVQQAAERVRGAMGRGTFQGDLTVGEIAERLAEELRRGLVESTAQGRDVPVPVGEGTELMAAAWSAIGQIRAHLADRSGGRLRFRESHPPGGPSFITLTGEERAEDPSIDLSGRRLLVVDDDEAVRWFFDQLLTEHGARVVTAPDGRAALQEARRARPDVVLTDILMPRLDGFALTRALGQDPSLSDVPVILLSWKEDYLHRMRQLKSGAAAYLRKEAGSGQILQAVADVLEPVRRLESQLTTEEEVRGRVEGVGLPTLLRSTATQRPDARITIRDAANLYEADLRGGELVDLTRTATDGAFARGENVLPSLLGVRSGRFTVGRDASHTRRSIEGRLDEQLDGGLLELAARVDALAGRGLSQAASVKLDEALLDSVLRTSATPMRQVVEALSRGKGPRGLLLDGGIDPQVLEEVLLDLARQGAVLEVRGSEGEDRVAMAREGRLDEAEQPSPSGNPPPLDEPFATTTRPRRKRRRDSEAALAIAELQAELAARDAAAARGEGEGPAADSTPPKIDSWPQLASDPEAEPPPREQDDFIEEAVERTTRTSKVPDGLSVDTSVEIDALAELEGDWDEAAPVVDAATIAAAASGEMDALDIIAATAERRDEVDAPVGGVQEEGEEDDADPILELVEEDAEPQDLLSDEEAGAPAAEDDAGEDDDAVEATPAEGPASREPPRQEALEERAGEDDAPEDDAPGASDAAMPPSGLKIPPSPQMVEDAAAAAESLPPPPPAQGSSWIGYALVLAALAAIGFLGWRFLYGGPTPARGSAVASEDGVIDDPVPPADGEPSAPLRSAAPAPAEPTALLPDLGLPAPYGREEDGVADLGVAVADGEGLLVLEPAAAPLRVTVGDETLEIDGEAQAVAMPEGVHHLVVQRGDHRDYVFVPVRAGRTRYVPPLP